MKITSIVLTAGVLAGASVQPASAAEATKVKEKILHSFGGGTDGQDPLSGLTDVKGTLYGTTSAGGTANGGTVFALDPGTDREMVLYSFCSQQNCLDGQDPVGGLVDIKGTLYGTTVEGGTAGLGTVFALNPSTGTETVLYSFCIRQDCADGAFPYATLINVKGMLYGTTQQGGSGPAGTVFTVDPNTRTESVLYSFCSQNCGTDGIQPKVGVIAAGGTLYGTTSAGGSGGLGVVYAVDPSTDAERVLYSFCSQQHCADGAEPMASLISTKGTLYGTTLQGGASNLGTVFALAPNTGEERVLHSFTGGTDGEETEAGLIDMKGHLYGVTAAGGTDGYGMAFKIDLKENLETVLYSFCGHRNESCDDAEYPEASLINVNGSLYGTSTKGGAYGYGAVFLLKP